MLYTFRVVGTASAPAERESGRRASGNRGNLLVCTSNRWWGVHPPCPPKMKIKNSGVWYPSLHEIPMLCTKGYPAFIFFWGGILKTSNISSDLFFDGLVLPEIFSG